ncbi:MAG: Holliday junction branch migration protein RuvA [Bacteroidia bacterium]|nr:Holliday junction branch migration protein RuvA [Bacteroidia bacterium]
MYEYFQGKLVEKTPTHCVVDCNGVAFHLNISLSTSAKLGISKECKLYAYLAVREDAHVLYGFFDTGERDMFRMLISVSGVGAATARMILSSLSPEEIAGGIAAGNVSLFKSVKGIGEKSAQRIIVDLKNKVGKTGAPVNFLTAHNKTREEALSALTALGFTRAAGEKALEKVIKSDPSDRPAEQLIKEALKFL